jgi:beta-glucanase (GH16 family)
LITLTFSKESRITVNSKTTKMANIFSLLFGSKYPSTAKYESQLLKLKADYKKYQEFETSIIYQRYKELDEIIHAGDFEKQVEKLKHEKFSDTEAFHQYNKYHTLLKSHDIHHYIKFRDSGKAQKLEDILISAEYIEYKELEMIINSASFQEAKHQKDFKKSEEHQQEIRFHKLAKHANIIFAEEVLKSKEFHNYNNTKDSAQLADFEKLEKYINSAEFKELKAFMEDKHRFHKSEESKLLHEYNELISSDDFKWYQHTQKNYPFAEIEKWQLTFEDDFDHTKLDASKWMTGYYWGKALLNDTYVMADEKQFFTDKNIELRDSILHINTRKEACKGRIWHPETGFRQASFDYTSGIVCSGHSFRMQYGKIEIKARFSTVENLSHAVWMVGEKKMPHINILKSGAKNAKEFETGTFIQKGEKISSTHQTTKGPSLNSDFHIFTFEWSATKMVWKINGVEVNVQTTDIPSEPMYLTISSHILKSINDSKLPSSIEIDWIRCYENK